MMMLKTTQFSSSSKPLALWLANEGYNEKKTKQAENKSDQIRESFFMIQETQMKDEVRCISSIYVELHNPIASRIAVE